MALIAVFYNYMPLTSIRMCSQHAALHIRRRFGSLVFVQVLFFPVILIFRQLGHYRPTCCGFIFFFLSLLVPCAHLSCETCSRVRSCASLQTSCCNVPSPLLCFVCYFLLFVSAVIKLASLCTTQLWVQDAIAFFPKHN